jgi:hypothetical protein
MAVGAVVLPALSQGLWSGGSLPASSRPATDAGVSRAGYLLLAVDQVVLPVKDYLRTGDARERDGFEQQLRRLHDNIRALDASDEAEVRRVAAEFRGQVSRLEALSHALVNLPARRDEIATAAGLQQLGAVRDELLATAGDLREIDAKKQVAESASGGPSIHWIVGGGFLGLGLSLVAGLGLARFAVA